jgi:uncharacterized protein
MSDRERGGFYASQDADINLDDDGDYFTWTLDEAREALQAGGIFPRRTRVALRYWDIGELGDMHHNPAKNVLHLKQTLEELAAQPASLDGTSAPASGFDRPRKLLAARAQRPTPFHRPHALHRLERHGGHGLSGAARVLRIDPRASSPCSRSTGCSTKPGTAPPLRHVIAYGDRNRP